MSTSLHHTEIQLFEPDPSVLYSVDAAARMLGISRRTILLCCKYGLIKASIDPASGGWFFREEALRSLRKVEELRTFCGGNFEAVQMILGLEKELNRLEQELRFWRR